MSLNSIMLHEHIHRHSDQAMPNLRLRVSCLLPGKQNNEKPRCCRHTPAWHPLLLFSLLLTPCPFHSLPLPCLPPLLFSHFFLYFPLGVNWWQSICSVLPFRGAFNFDNTVHPLKAFYIHNNCHCGDHKITLIFFEPFLNRTATEGNILGLLLPCVLRIHFLCPCAWYILG